MNKKRILLTFLVIATMVTSLTGCKQSNQASTTEEGGNKLKNPNIVYLCQSKEEEERDPVKNPIRAAAIKNYEQTTGGKITFVFSPYAEKTGKLAAMMAAGSPPDFVAPINGYPKYVIGDYVTPIDDLINLKDPIWKDVKDAYDATEWKGKHPFIITNKGPLNVTWYNKALFENNGLKTPYELYKEGNWNWNTFRDSAIKLTQDTDGDKVIDQWGYAMPGPEPLFASSGQDLIKINPTAGTIENNLKNPDVIRDFQFFQESGPAKYNIIQPDLNAYMTDFGKGKIGMAVLAIWADTVWFADAMKKGQCSFVPAPKDPNVSDYYVGGSADLWMIPKGAANPKGAAAFLTELRKAQIDPQVIKSAEDGNVKNRGWKDQEVEMNKELNKLKYTYSWFGGIDALNSDRYGLWYELRVAGLPVQTAVEKHFNVWNNEIDIASGKVKLQHNEVAATAGTPKIDGEIDDAWKNAQEIATDQEKGTPDIATAKVKLLYDADTLYVLAQVSDKKVMSDNKNPWECDSVEIFVDENKAQGGTYDPNTVQLRVGADGKITGGGAGWDEKRGALTASVKKVDGGYIVEAAYKFKSAKAKAGGQMGFNVSVNDEEETGKRKGTSVWNPDSGTSYANPSRFGVVTFK